MKVTFPILYLMSASIMHTSEPLFLTEKNPDSERNVILEELGGSAWLYLSEPSTLKPEKDAFAYSLIEPTEKTDWEHVKDGNPPKLSKEYASPTAVLHHTKTEDFDFKWADKGNSVALVYKGVIIAVILQEEKRGFSLALSKSGPLGHPFDTTKIERFKNE